MKDVRLPLHAQAFSALLPLLGHHALDADDVPATNPNFVVRLKKAFIHASAKQFAIDAGNLAGDTNLAIRSNTVYLRTENLLTARFIPPRAEVVGTSLETALKLIFAELHRHRGELAKTAACALLGAQVLLTIHPLRDGNGRTARMFLAAQTLRHLGPAPTVLLGMMLIQSAGAHQYHQAMWAFRAGDAEPMLELIVQSLAMAEERFMPHGFPTFPPSDFLVHCWRELQYLR